MLNKHRRRLSLSILLSAFHYIFKSVFLTFSDLAYQKSLKEVFIIFVCLAFENEFTVNWNKLISLSPSGADFTKGVNYVFYSFLSLGFGLSKIGKKTYPLIFQAQLCEGVLSQSKEINAISTEWGEFCERCELWHSRIYFDTRVFPPIFHRF